MKKVYIVFILLIFFSNQILGQSDPFKWNRLPSDSEINTAKRKLLNSLNQDISVNGDVVDNQRGKLSPVVKFHNKNLARKVPPEDISRCIVWAEINGIAGSTIKEYNLFQSKQSGKFGFVKTVFGVPGNSLKEQYDGFISNATSDENNNIALGFAPGLAGSLSNDDSSSNDSDDYPTTSQGDEDSVWTIVIGAVSAILVGGIVSKIKNRTKTPKQNGEQNRGKKNPRKREEDEEYILQISRDTIDLTKKKSSSFTIHVWKITAKGKFATDASIEIINSESALHISPQKGSGTFRSKLTLKDISKQSRFTIDVVANAKGHIVQKEITIIAEGEKQLIIQTVPENTKSLRPNLNITFTCKAKMVDEEGKALIEESKNIKFKPQSNWIDLSEPVLDGKWVAINVGASDPDATVVVSHPPKSVTLTVFVEYKEDGKKKLLQKDIEIQLLDCILDTNIENISLPATKEQSEVTFKTFIKSCDGKTPWQFKAGYKTDDYRIDNKPLTTILVTPISDTKAEIKVTGPILLPNSNEKYLRKMLLIEAYQKNEDSLKREIYVTVSKAGLYIENGADKNDTVKFTAKGDYTHTLEFGLYVYDEEGQEIVVDKLGLENLDIQLIDKEEKLKNINSVLKPELEFDDYTTTIPRARYILNIPEKFPGFGDYYELHYRIKVLDAKYDQSLKFERIITLKVQDYGIGEKFPDWQKAYEQCKYTIIEYVPTSDERHQLLDMLEKRKYKFDIEGMVQYRKMVWSIARNLTLNKRDGYLAIANWHDAIIDTLDWVVWMGDLAFQVVVATYTGTVGGLAASAFKDTFLTGVRLAIEGKSVDDFVKDEIELLIQMMYSVAKGSAINTRNIEKVYKGNKLKVWAIYAVATFALQYQRTGSIPQAATETAKQLRDEAIISFLHGKVMEQQSKIQIKESEKAKAKQEKENQLRRDGRDDYEPSHEAPDVSGYTEGSIKAIRRIATKLKIQIITRPTNAAAKALLKSGQAVPKKMFVKNKTINKLDTYLGASKSNIGKVGSFKPKLNKTQLRALPKELRKEIVKRYKQRRRELINQAEHLSENIAKGKLKVKNGVVYDAVSHKPFTGDIDIYDIRGLNGEKISKAKYLEAIKELTKSEFTNVEHGAHRFWEHWKGKANDITTNEGISDTINKGHRKEFINSKGERVKGEALVVFKPGVGVDFTGVYRKAK